VQHALAAQEWEPAARLVEDHSLQLIVTGQLDTVLGWLTTFPAVVMQLRQSSVSSMPSD
jgi:ATP/maltotriose-dependent transcriptional regulator MalT